MQESDGALGLKSFESPFPPPPASPHSEMYRRQKTEDARRETMAILEAQAEDVRQKKAEMDKRDFERAKRMAAEAKERAIANEEKRKKAELRIMSE